MKRTNVLELILEAIPRDEWVSASEIAEKTGLNKQAIGATIGYNLLQYVERKRFTDSGKSYFYKRIN